ncbi:MAG: SDR family NAD(P)-dependent oxidoreductase [Actinomycetota bacterium]
MTTVLITGSTDGIGLATAEQLAADGHDVVLHGRSAEKLDRARAAVEARRSDAVVDAVSCDLGDLRAVAEFATQLPVVDVLVNNAGVFRTSSPRTPDGLDIRFVVNTVAPYLLARAFLTPVPTDGRVVNLSSAAQAPVHLGALTGDVVIEDAGAAYAQSKLALTMWTRHVADEMGPTGPLVVSVNPGSLLATKMVKEGYGMDGHDISIGVGALVGASVGDSFLGHNGAYFDNDVRRFADPHPDALDTAKNAAVVAAVESVISRHT